MLFCILLNWKYIQGKHYAILAARYCESKAILSKKGFAPINRPGVFKWENFHPQSQYQFGGKHWDLGNRTGSSSRSHMNTSRFLQRKLEWGETSVTGKARSIGLIKENYRSTACVLFRGWQTAPLIRIDVVVDKQSGEEFFAQTCPFDYLHLFALCSKRSFCRIRQVWLTHVLYTSTWMPFSTF